MLEGKTLLIGVGAQKAGTTWLARYFDEHPEVFMAPLKELHFFTGLRFGFAEMDRRIVERMTNLAIRLACTSSGGNQRDRDLLENFVERLRMVRNPERYLQYFNAHVGTCEVACEISPSYSLLGSEDFSAMRNLHSDVKFIFIMRNPVNRYWSQLRFDQRRLRQHGERFEAVDQVESTLMQARYFERSNYPRVMNALREAAEPHEVFFGFYEELFRNETVGKICRFLGISDHSANFDLQFNPSPEIRMRQEDRERAFRAFRFVYDEVRALMGRLPAEWEADLEAYGGR